MQKDPFSEWTSSNASACSSTIIDSMGLSYAGFAMFVAENCCANQTSKCDGDFSSICEEPSDWTPAKELISMGDCVNELPFETDYFCSNDYLICEGVAWYTDVFYDDFFPLTCSDVSDLS